MPAELKLVKDGAPEVSSEGLRLAGESATALVEAVKAGGGFWLLLAGEDWEVKYVGDALELSAAAEESARRIKMLALGLDE